MKTSHFKSSDVAVATIFRKEFREWLLGVMIYFKLNHEAVGKVLLLRRFKGLLRCLFRCGLNCCSGVHPCRGHCSHHTWEGISLHHLEAVSVPNNWTEGRSIEAWVEECSCE